MLSENLSCPECGEYRMVFFSTASGDRVQCRECNAIGYASTCWVRTGKAGDINPTRNRRTKESESIKTLEKVIGNFLDDPMRFVGMDISDIYENLSPVLSDSQKTEFWEAYENREKKKYLKEVQEYLASTEGMER